MHLYKDDFYYRDSDKVILEEVFDHGIYNDLKINNQDVVLDLGTNIGTFARWCHNNKAKQIVGYEPCKDNYNLAYKNVGTFAKIINKAVVGDDKQTMDMYVSSVNSGKGSSVANYRKEGTERVDCENINSVLSKHLFTCLKMDVEGGEIDILEGIKDFGTIDKMAIEYHNNIFKKTYGKNLYLLGDLIFKLENNNFAINFKYDHYQFLIFANRSRNDKKR
jgi:FkbM family methyltransferase